VNDPAAGLAALMPPAFWIGLAGLAVAVVLLAMAAADDRKNWIVERAPPLPIEFLNPHDDVWVSGVLECPTPLTIPHFGAGCVYYEFVERERRVTARGSVQWRTVQRYAQAVDFDLVTARGRIGVAAGDAEFDGLSRCGPQSDGGSIQRSARYLPYPGAADAVGSVADDGRRLERRRNIPLIVTTRGRKQYIAGRERAESWRRGLGAVMLPGSLFGILLGASLKLDVPAAAADGALTGKILAAAGLALAGFAAWWVAYTYNQLVMYRERVRTAWRQIDVDLKNRFDLIPRLEALVRTYAAHEQEIMELAARLGQQSSAGDRGALPGGQLVRIWALAEQNPELKANQAFGQLRTRLTALEEKLAHGRAFYNESVQEYDNQRLSFPKNSVARLAGRFPVYPFFAD
jgi:LemA protein